MLLPCAEAFPQDSVYIMMDEPYSTDPVHFRKCDGGFNREFSKMPDTTGLNNAGLSGSAEFNESNLPEILRIIGRKQLTVVDLRQETHFLVNGISISWYGKYDWADVGLSRNEVLQLEQKRMDSVVNAKYLRVIRVIKKERESGTFKEVKDTILTVQNVRSEEELVNSFGHGYFRITATDRREPSPEDADRFIVFARELNPETWLHFHCHAGDGRTTTFMTMFDMMQNSKSVNCDDIVERQYLLGGINLYNDDDYPPYEKPYAIKRTEFIKSFYSYCRENTDGFKTLFSEWIKN